jgi:GNAT superfamily N-acetyltransferase
MDFSIRAILPSDFKRIYKKIKRDFAPGEYAPYTVLYKQLKKGIQQGFLLYAGGDEAAYAVCAAGHPNGFVLVSLLAVYPEYRGRGFGTEFIRELKKIYTDKKGVIVEVEKPEDAKDEDEKTRREKRIAFYRKAGFEQIPGIEYSIWTVPMHLMVFPGGILSPREAGAVMHEIYLELMGKHFIHMMKFREVADF